MADRFETFTERARKVLTLAQDEAHRFNHNYIGTEHLLLGLVREGDGVAARVLASMGVQLPKVRAAIQYIVGRGDTNIVGAIGLTPRAKKVIELAIDEARRLNHHYIGTEHLLLGLIREGQGVAAGVLESMGVNLEKVRPAILQAMQSHGEPVETELAPPEPSPSTFGRWRSPESPLPAFGELRRVVALGESRVVDKVEATILSLELYESGTVLHARFRRLSDDASTPSRPWQGSPIIDVTDASGTTLPTGRYSSFHRTADAFFITNRFTAAVSTDATRLKITVHGGSDPNFDPMPPERVVNRASTDPERAAQYQQPPGLRRWEFDIEL